MPARKKEPEDLTAKKELALEVIRPAQKRISGCRLHTGLRSRMAAAGQRAAGGPVHGRPGEYRSGGPVCPLPQRGRTGRCRAGGHRGHRQALRTGALQGAGYLGLHAHAAGQVQLPGAYYL
mgnify:CR=1 FL=1